MLVRDCMQREVVTVSPDDTLATAIRLTSSHRLRHLPVLLANGDLAGILSDRDIRLAMPSPLATPDAEASEFLARTAIAAIMTREVITIEPDAPIEEAAKLIHRHRISSLPVLDERLRLVGILTETDILRAFLQILGVSEPSTRIELMLRDRPGELGRAMSVIGDRAGVNIVSVLVPPAPPSGSRRAVLHLATIDPREALRELDAAGFSVGWPGLKRVDEPLMPLPG
jgi:acetoin utilization protein AcuB